MKKRKSRILVLFLAVLLVSVLSCENPFLKKMLVEEEKGNESTVLNTPYAPFVEGGASLILTPGTTTIKVTANTSDDFAIEVEGCTETTLAGNGLPATPHVKPSVTKVVLKGKITWLNCDDNQLTALNVQGLTALQTLDCSANRLTDLNVQGLNNLQTLGCCCNPLTALDVRGCTALKRLYCYRNQLTALNVQDCTALKELVCEENQLTALNVQGLNNLETLICCKNRLTALNVQGCTALKRLYCYNNQLTAEVFTQIFNDLPQRDAGDNAKCWLYTEEPGGGNHTDFTTPSEVQAAFENAKDVKHWKMYKLNTSGPFWEEI